MVNALRNLAETNHSIRQRSVESFSLFRRIILALGIAVVCSCKCPPHPNSRHPERSEWTTVLVVAVAVVLAIVLLLASGYPKASALDLIAHKKHGALALGARSTPPADNPSIYCLPYLCPYGTGSNPPLANGWHRANLRTAIHPPFSHPYRTTATYPYSLQVGRYLHCVMPTE
jgi:hypothetical protein